jgi:hypothetical protein
MNITTDPSQQPEKYYCEICRPEDHQELLSAIERGEKPWDERRKQREEEQRQKKGKRGRKSKGGKKGAAASNVKAANSNVGTASAVADSKDTKLPSQETKVSHDNVQGNGRAMTSKRKSRGEIADVDPPKVSNVYSVLP